MRLSANKPATFIEALTDDASVYSVFASAQKLNMNDDFECSVVESMNKIVDSNNIAYRLYIYDVQVSCSAAHSHILCDIRRGYM
mgnify:CR=1 FL=1